MIETPYNAEKLDKNFRWWVSCLRFIAIHLLCGLAFWVGFDGWDLLICLGFYVVHMFFVTAGYHRYFSHRTFKLGRFAQFVFAWGAQQTAQKGVLWWAAHHRHHHKYSDEPDDVHSVKQGGFWWAHVGWIFHPRWAPTDLKRVKDLAKFPELVWLNRYPLLPTVVLGAVCFLVGGWTGLIVWFLWSLVLTWHGTFTINSLSHVFGSQRYETGDDSRNNWLLAIITLGEGWHNNHHRFQSSVKQGFFWWEYDITYYVLWVLSKVGVVSDLKLPPHHVVHNVPNAVTAAIATFKAQSNSVREEALESLAAARAAFDERVEELSVALDLGKSTASAEIVDAMWSAQLRFDDILATADTRMENLKAASIDAEARTRKRVHEMQAAMTIHMDELREEVETLRQEMAYRVSLANA